MNKKTYIDVNHLYKQVQERGQAVVRRGCCGREKKRTDYENMLQLLGMKGSFIIKDNGIVVAVVTV